MMLRIVVLGLLVAACTGMAETTTTAVAPATTAAPVSATSTTEATTTTVSRRVFFQEEFGVRERRSLTEGTTYVMEFDGFTVEITPPMSEWVMLGYGQSRAVLAWEGPMGFRNGALELVIYDVAADGVEASWSRVEGLRGRLYRDLDWDWTWVEQGTALVGDREVEWREVRLPPIPADDPDPDDRNALPIVESPFQVVLGHDSSARFYVVPVADLTVTVLAWESRCMCPEGSVLGRFEFIDRDGENELSMWIDELEAFLAAMEFVES